MIKGKILKGIAGFYYVYAGETGLVECHAKGIFRNQGIKPLVGDLVEFELTDGEHKKGNLAVVLERKNELLRPNVANVDQVLILFSAVKPEPNLNLLDRFLLLMEKNRIEVLICFNKQDIATKEQLAALAGVYEKSGYPLLFFSAKEEQGTDDLKMHLEGKTTVLAGPSGVGKSTLCNLIFPKANMQTGGISKKIDRGKHTTRHSELFYIGNGTYLMDTPGFTSLLLPELEKEEIQAYFPEFKELAQVCRFQGCAHINEPGCAVKEALEEGKINALRYENYKLFYEEARNRKRY